MTPTDSADAGEGGESGWERWRGRWPNADASRFVETAGIRWHVQVAGRGPMVLLLHGTGAATHSWRDLLPRLATHFTVVAPDLPGHGFTSRPPTDAGLSLSGMASAITELLHALGMTPALGVGHSAGAAVLLQRAADGLAPRGAIVGLNAAIAPPPTAYSAWLAPVVRELVAPMAVARAAAWLVSATAFTGTLLDSTGTRVPAEQAAIYEAFTRSPEHLHAVLTMMGRWNLDRLARRLPTIDVPVTLVVGEHDRWIRPAQVREIGARLPNATIVSLPNAGHLVHESDPDAVAAIILDAARRSIRTGDLEVGE